MYSFNYDISGVSSAIELMGVGFYAIVLGYCILSIAAMWKLFNDFEEEGWKSLIPIYNSYILYKHSDINPNLTFLVFIPCVGALILYILNVKAIINLKNKKGSKATGGFVALAILLQPIAIALLAFYSGKAKEEKIEEVKKEEVPTVEEEVTIPQSTLNDSPVIPVTPVEPVPPVVEEPTPEEREATIPEAPTFDTMPAPEEPMIPQQPEMDEQETMSVPEVSVDSLQNIAPPTIPGVTEDDDQNQN